MYRLNAIVNLEIDNMRGVSGFLSFRVTEKSPQSIWQLDSGAGIRESRLERSMSAPAGGGGSKVTAFDGTSRGVAVNREYFDFEGSREE